MRSWHARVWASVLLEIPRQVYEYDQSLRTSVDERIDFLEQHYPGSQEIADLRTQVPTDKAIRSALTPMESTTALGCTIASISRVRAQWPTFDEVKVEFALCRAGLLRIRCTNAASGASLPPVIRDPRTDTTPEAEATSYVQGAMRIVSPSGDRW